MYYSSSYIYCEIEYNITIRLDIKLMGDKLVSSNYINNFDSCIISENGQSPSDIGRRVLVSVIQYNGVLRWNTVDGADSRKLPVCLHIQTGDPVEPELFCGILRPQQVSDQPHEPLVLREEDHQATDRGRRQLVRVL